jgi:hypothetical protein
LLATYQTFFLSERERINFLVLLVLLQAGAGSAAATTPFSLEQIFEQIFLRDGHVHTRNIQVWVLQDLSI